MKTRTLASALIQDGRVRLNRERISKPKQLVRPGDVLTVSVHRHVRVLKVVLPGTRRGPASEAQTLYEDLTPPSRPASEGSSATEGAVPAREPGSGRPTKRERRQMDQWRRRTE